MAHAKGLAGMLSPRRAKGLLREAVGLGTHVCLYPLGMIGRPIRHSEAPACVGVPVILVHGYFHNRSGFFFMARRLRRAGFGCVYSMNYNALNGSIETLAAQLARHVTDVLRVSGAPRVHLVGHSLGGVIARYYVQELGGHDHVDHLVTIGTPHAGTYAAYAGFGRTAAQMRPGSGLLRRLAEGLPDCDTKIVNLYSDLDVLIVPPSSAVLPDAPNVVNLLLHDLGHTSLLISPELIATVTEHLAAAALAAPLAEVRQLRSLPAPGRRAVQS
jgi:hypothetical protein